MLSLVVCAPAMVQPRGADARAFARAGTTTTFAEPTEAFRGGVVPTNRRGGSLRPSERVGGVVPTNRGINAFPVAPAPPVHQHHPSASVQGGSLRTFSQHYPTPEHNQVTIGTDGRPLDASIETWAGPGNTPRRMRVYSEDGYLRPFHSAEPPRGQPNTMAVRNTGPLEFPIHAHIAADPTWAAAEAEVITTRPHHAPLSAELPGGAVGVVAPIPGTHRERMLAASGRARFDSGMNIQGGATKSFPVEASVGSVLVHLQTQGRNLDATIEVLQGPDCVRQVIELNEDYGYDRPFSCVIETPGYGSVVRIINTAPMTFPFSASVVPHSLSQPSYEDSYPVLGGGAGAWGGQRSVGGYQSGQSSLGGYQGGQSSLGGYHASPQGGRYDPNGSRYGPTVY